MSFNVAVNVFDGAVSSCNFYGQEAQIDDGSGVAVEMWQVSRLTDCKIEDSHVYTYGYQAVVNGNIFYKNNLTGSDKPSIRVQTSVQVHITDNTFVGAGPDPDESYIVMGGECLGVTIADNVFDDGGIELPSDDPFETGFGNGANTDSINIINNTFYGSGSIASKDTTTSHRLANLIISGNKFVPTFGGDAGGEGGRITITGTRKEVNRLRITKNIFHTFSNTAGDPIIEVDYTKDSLYDAAEKYLIDISDNTISVWQRPYWDTPANAGPNTKAIKLQGVATYPYRGYIVINGNHIQGSDGIDVSDATNVTMKYNTFVPHPYSYDTTEDYSAQVEIAATKMASVESNVFAAGEDGDSYGTTALVKVSVSESGSLIDNTFYGANAGSLVTACIADGPLYIDGNQYPGPHPLLGGTAFTNELVVTGSGAIMGSNSMGFDATAATNVKHLHMREVVVSKGGTLSTGAGTLRLPFREDAQIVSVSAMVGTAPTGASIIVDVQNSETQASIFSPASTRPTILATEFDSGEVVPNDIWVNAGEYLTVDVDQVGSTVAGEDLTVMILWVRNYADPYP